MLINVLDVNLQKVAFLSNDVPALPNYYDDEFHEYRDQGAATFKFTVKKVINNKLQLYARFLNGQSYFSFQIDGNDYLMTPASEQAIHETSEEISFFCVSLDRELMSEQANPLVNTSSHNIQWYFDQMGLISNTQITIGINEVSNLTRTINYDGQETKLARLVSVIGNFDAEFEFITKLNNDGSLGSVTLNIYKENDGLNIQGVGKKRDDVRLIFGENIQAVERDVSTEGFLNATTVTGADDLNWNSASFSYINADGVEEFYKRAGSDTAFAPLSAKIYPAQLSKDKDDIWTRIDFTTEYKSVNDMWAYAVRQFKQYAYHQVTYTVTPSSKLVNAEIGDGPPLAKGDTVIIQDNNYIDIDGNVGLLLSARVSEKIVSETHPENNKLIFSNYKKLKSEVSTDIQAIVNQLVDAATPYIGSIDTTNGTQFKNGTGSTTLSAHIFKGSATTETIADSYEWSKDGTVIAPTQTITVDASGVADKAVYYFKATVAGKVVASQSVTITNVNDGEAGSPGIPGVPGADGRSVTNIEQKYRLTTSSSIPTQDWSDSGWLTTQPTTTVTNKYLWSITRTTFNLAPLTQDIVEQKAVYGDKGESGDDGKPGTPGTSAINIDLSNKSYNFLANLEVSDSGSVMQAVAGSTTTTFTALQGTAAINITALTCTTTLPTGMTVSIGTLNALSVVVTISVDDTMITPNGILNFSITAGGVTTTKSFSYSLAINDLTVINLAAINSNLGNVKNIYSHYNGSDGGTYSGTIEINDENIKIIATNDNDSNEVSKTQMNGENGIWHSTKLQKTNSPGVYVLSNWSLTGTTLSFESQQSDLTYPNGYYYASYGIDIHARNIVGDSISQTTDVPWTDITRASGVGTSGTLRARINNGVFYAQSKDVTIPSIAPNSLITIGTMSSKFSGVSGFDTLGLLYSPGQLSVASVTVGKDGKIDIGNPNPTTMSGKVIQFSINIPLG